MLKIFISPAKKMNDTSDDFIAESKPIFLKEANHLLSYLKNLSFAQLKAVYKASDQIVLENKERLMMTNLDEALSCALFSYEGIQYQYMAPSILEKEALDYLSDHLYILSGLYGLLRPFDAIVPYRLEMQAKLKDFEVSNLYDYWNESIYEKLKEDASVLINLASFEYSKIILKYNKLPIINIHFKEEVDGKLKEKGVYVKMARGAMVRYMAEHKIEDVEEIKEFKELDYHFDEALSDDSNYYFIRSKEK